MASYYFDLYNDVVTIGEEAWEFPDLAAARDAAILQIRALAAHSVQEHGHLILSHKLVIRDESGEVALITVGEAIAVRD
ncbi:hypothetical protein P1X14_00160 [Sphingomonas sp. AOB5]|uniref:DUF6894 family protein n=1 Tax=Sphingomonas sp. AOB5 TaxID=3034017 RepID=UPI0023F96726|nr:hypothetical protein [Sphingomonas sp. AOB5]MDF7773644.1 hypothetical protein [Sphingomonas sp. AOB5]